MKHVQQNPHNYLKRFGDLWPHLSETENSYFSVSQTLVAQHIRVLACPLALGLERVQLPETMFAHQNLFYSVTDLQFIHEYLFYSFSYLQFIHQNLFYSFTDLQFYNFTVLQIYNFTVYSSTFDSSKLVLLFRGTINKTCFTIH